MELEWAWTPDFCCGRDKMGGSFDVLGDEDDGGSASEGDDGDEWCEHESMTLFEEKQHQCTGMRRTHHDSHATCLKLPRGSIRWLKQKVPEHTLRHIESLVKRLHTRSNSRMTSGDRIGVLHLPSPFHRAILHAICRWWGAESRSEYRRGVREDEHHVVVDEEGEEGEEGAEQASDSLHRVTIIGKGGMPEVFLADRIFKHGTSWRGNKGEGQYTGRE